MVVNMAPVCLAAYEIQAEDFVTIIRTVFQTSGAFPALQKADHHMVAWLNFGYSDSHVLYYSESFMTLQDWKRCRVYLILEGQVCLANAAGRNLYLYFIGSGSVKFYLFK